MKLVNWSVLARMPPNPSRCNCKHHQHQRMLASKEHIHSNNNNNINNDSWPRQHDHINNYHPNMTSFANSTTHYGSTESDAALIKSPILRFFGRGKPLIFICFIKLVTRIILFVIKILIIIIAGVCFIMQLKVVFSARR